MKRSTLAVLICLIFFLLVSISGEAQDPTKDMKNEDVIARIASIVEHEDAVLELVPQLKKRTDDKGSVYYIYRVGSKETRLSDLDKEALRKVLAMVSQAAAQIWANRIQKQLETIAQTQNVQRATQQAMQVQPPPAPPRVQQPQTQPRVPAPVYQPPKK